MSESKSRPLKIALTKTDLNGKFGDDIEFTADLSTVKEAILGTAGAVGLENCLKLGNGAAVATALYVVVRSIKRKWPWVNMANVKKDVLEVSIPPNKEERFSALMKNNIIEEKLVQDFKKLSANLEDILEEDDSDQYGKDILDRLKYVRIKSIRDPTENSSPESVVTALYVGGDREVNEVGISRNVFQSADCKGTGIVIAGEFIANGGKMTGESRNVSTVVANGFSASDAAELAKVANGDLIQVRITGEQFDHAFEQGFKPTMTIWDVCKEIRAQMQPFSKFKVKISRGEVVLGENLTLAQAAMDGSTRNWKAAFEELKQ